MLRRVGEAYRRSKIRLHEFVVPHLCGIQLNNCRLKPGLRTTVSKIRQLTVANASSAASLAPGPQLQVCFDVHGGYSKLTLYF